MNMPPGHFIRGSRGMEYQLDACPFCGRAEHFFWNPGRAMGHCKAGDCTGKIFGNYQFAKITGGGFSPGDDQIDALANWKTYFTNQNVPASIHGKQIDPAAQVTSRLYLERRGVDIDPEDSTLRWSEEDKALTIEIDPWSPEYPVSHLYRPINRPDSKWMHLSDPNASRYGYGLRHHVGITVMLVEGVFDVLTPQLLGVAVATLGTTLRTDALAWMLERGVQRTILWLDPDTAGYKAMKKTSEQLEGWGLEVVAVVPSKVKMEELGICEDPREMIHASVYIESDAEPGDLNPRHPTIIEALRYRL